MRSSYGGLEAEAERLEAAEAAAAPRRPPPRAQPLRRAYFALEAAASHASHVVVLAPTEEHGRKQRGVDVL